MEPSENPSSSSDTGSESTNEANNSLLSGESKRVIQPSAEFVAEMTSEKADEPKSESHATVDEVPSKGAAKPPHETPAAVKDFINSEAATEPETNSAGFTAGSTPDLPKPPEPISDISTSNDGQSLAEPASPTANTNDVSQQLPSIGGVAVGNSQIPADKKRSKKRWVKSLITAVIVLILAAAAYIYFIYLPNTPSAVYSSSLSRTGEAVDQLISYSQNNDLSNYESVALNGNVQVNGKNYNFNGSLNGDYDKNGNTTTNLGVDAKTQGDTNSHIKANLNLLTLKANGQSYPDVYFKITGIDSILSAFGGSASPLEQLDGKWIVISHQDVEQYAKQYSGQTVQSNVKEPTKAEIYDAINKVQAVNKKYIFTDNKDTAVLVKKQYLGAETKYGESAYHYKVGYNKAHLVAYVNAVGQALDASSLNSWSEQTYKKSLSEEIDINSVKNQIQKKADSNYTFDMWSDRKTKLVEAVEFDDNQKNNTSSVTFAQTYSGGKVYPFRIDVSGNDHGDKGSATVKLNIDSASHQVTTSFSFNDDNNGNVTTASGNFEIAPSNSKTSVTAPENAETLENVLKQLGLGGSITP